MKTATITQTKNGLSALLDRVQHGETIVITDRSRPVARLEPGPMQLNLTNGRKLDTYEVEVGAQEVVETPMGDLRTLYVKQLRKPGDEGIEVWLAVDFAYLPVRLRFTDRAGSIAAEQIVSAIQLVRG